MSKKNKIKSPEEELKEAREKVFERRCEANRKQIERKAQNIAKTLGAVENWRGNIVGREIGMGPCGEMKGLILAYATPEDPNERWVIGYKKYVFAKDNLRIEYVGYSSSYDFASRPYYSAHENVEIFKHGQMVFSSYSLSDDKSYSHDITSYFPGSWTNELDQLDSRIVQEVHIREEGKRQRATLEARVALAQKFGV